VTIPNGVTSIGNSAFLTCPNLLTIYIKGNAPSLGTTVFSANSKSNVYYFPGTTGWTSTYGGIFTVVLRSPTITGQPSNVIANAGENAVFTVTATTTFPLTLTYQWQRNGLVIPSATTASLHLDNIQSANVGTYTVIVTNELGSVSSTVTLTLTQGTQYTQAQYDSALQTGLTIGLAAGITTGRTQVTDSPNNYGLYNLNQVQALHVGTPLLVKDPVSGKFKLTIGVKKSSDLLNFTAFPISPGAAMLNAKGEMEFQFTSPDNAAFYRLESH
jgi:Immunoglobulin domain